MVNSIGGLLYCMGNCVPCNHKRSAGIPLRRSVRKCDKWSKMKVVLRTPVRYNSNHMRQQAAQPEKEERHGVI